MIAKDINGIISDQYNANGKKKREPSCRRVLQFEELLLRENATSPKDLRKKKEPTSRIPQLAGHSVLNPRDFFVHDNSQSAAKFISQLIQILDYSIGKIDASNFNDLKLILMHPFLGKFQLSINCCNHRFNIRFHVSDFQTHKIIYSNLESLKMRLEKKNIGVRDLDCKFLRYDK